MYDMKISGIFEPKKVLFEDNLIRSFIEDDKYDEIINDLNEKYPNFDYKNRANETLLHQFVNKYYDEQMPWIAYFINFVNDHFVSPLPLSCTSYSIHSILGHTQEKMPLEKR